VPEPPGPDRTVTIVVLDPVKALCDDDGSLAHPVPGLADKVMSAEEAAALIEPGSNVGMSGFTGAGYPKAVPTALARRITEASARGEGFKVGVWTGPSTAPELDGALASVDGIDLRMPYQSDPVSRAKINAGRMDYLDVHLSHVAQMVWQGYFGHLGIALVEVAGITDDGDLIPSSSVGNNKNVIRLASHAHHYLAIFDKGRAIALYHRNRLASPGQRIVLYAKDRGC
jgi:acyl-CoA hydrolase